MSSLYIAGISTSSEIKGGSPLIQEGHYIVTKQQIFTVNQVTLNTVEKQAPSIGNVVSTENKHNHEQYFSNLLASHSDHSL